VIRISGFVAPSAVGEIPGLSKGGFKIYPNPATGYLKLEIGGVDPQGSIEIFSILGQQILKQDYAGIGIREFDLSAFPKGTYNILVHNGDVVGHQLFVKE
jgi:hypothetical protein